VHAAAVDAGDGPAVAWAAALAAFGAFPLVVVGAPEGSSAHGVGFACGVFAVQVGRGFLSGVVCGGVSVLSGARLPGSGAFVGRCGRFCGAGCGWVGLVGVRPSALILGGFLGLLWLCGSSSS